MMDILALSALSHTWLIDLDGTIVKHAGYKIDGHDTLLEGAEQFLKSLPEGDMIVLLTAREEAYRGMTEGFLTEHAIRYDHILFDVPVGERILVNDTKPGGLATAIAVNVERDGACDLGYRIDREK